MVSRLSIRYRHSFYLGEIFPRHGPKVSHKIVANSYTAVFELHKNTPTSTSQPRFGLTPNKFAPSYSFLFKQRYLAPQLQAPGVFFPNHPPPTFTSLLTTQIIPSFSNSILPTLRLWAMSGKYLSQIKRGLVSNRKTKL